MEFEDGVARRMCYVVMLGLGWCMSMAGARGLVLPILHRGVIDWG